MALNVDMLLDGTRKDYVIGGVLEKMVDRQDGKLNINLEPPVNLVLGMQNIS